MAEKVSRRLVILSAAAIAAVYAAGFQETRAADARMGGAIATSFPIATTVSGSTAGPATPTPVTATAVSPGMGALSAATAPTAVPTAAKASAATSEATSKTTSVAPVATSTTAGKPAATTTPTSRSTGLRDGVYQGSGTSRRGGIGVTVTVQNGRIARVAITQSSTQYPVSRIAGLPSEVVARQNAQVDLVSGATFSSLAFQGAVQQALAEAKVA